MPWKKGTLAGISAGLRHSAQKGRFVPGYWFEYDDTDNPAVCPAGCGWGIVAWLTAKAIGGIDRANSLLAIEDLSWEDIEEILMEAGLSRQEITSFAEESTWKRFDRELKPVYENSEQNWSAYIVVSMMLAEYFIKVLKRVDAVDEVPVPDRQPDLDSIPGQLMPWSAKSAEEPAIDTSHSDEVAGVSQAA